MHSFKLLPSSDFKNFPFVQLHIVLPLFFHSTCESVFVLMGQLYDHLITLSRVFLTFNHFLLTKGQKGSIIRNKKRGEKVKDRIKKIRKELDLTQQEFADRLGIKRNSVAKYETGENSPSAASISLICREFNVNEHWLRDGTGEMFVKVSKDEQISAFIGDMLKDEEDSFKRRLISGLCSLDDSGWNVLEQFIDSIQKKKD